MNNITYCPKHVSEMITNQHIVNELEDYLTKKTDNTLFIITGETGSGKTLSIDLTLNKLNKIKHEINDKITNSQLTEYINIWNMYNIKNKVYVFEEAGYNQDILNNLQKINIQNIKIIIILNEIKEVLKNHIVVTTKIINKKKYEQFLYDIYVKENVKKTKKECKLIIEKFNTNIREAMNYTYEYKRDYDSDIIIKEKILEALSDEHKDDIIKYDSIQSLGFFYQTYSQIKKKNILLTLCKSLIDADNFQTRYYSNGYINLEYIHYMTHKKCLNYFRRENIVDLESPKIWSMYSNICARKQVIYRMYKTNYVNFSIEKLLYTRYLIFNNMKNNLEMCKTLINKLGIENTKELIVLQKLYDDDLKKVCKTKDINVLKELIVLNNNE